MSSRPAGGDPRPTLGSGARRVDAACLLVLCLWSVFFYRHIALTNRVLAGADAMTYFYPYREYAAEALREGRLPLWNPYLFLGVPFFANPQAAVLYPLNLLLFWLPAPQLVAWSVVVHAAMAATFAYLYARSVLRLSALPALLGAGAFACGGFLSGQIEHVNQLNVSAWFPLLLLLWEGRSRARLPALLGSGAAIGVGLLAGHSQSSYITLVGLGIYALLPPASRLAYRLVLRVRRPAGAPPSPLRPALGQAGGALLDYALACAAGAALAAAQLVPALELSGLSIRSGGLSYREAVAFSLKPLPHLLRYAFFPPWGANLADIFGGSFFTEYLAYVGLVPFALAGFWVVAVGLELLRGSSSSLHERLSWTKIRLLALAAGGGLLALGAYNPLYLVLYKLVPGMGLFRVPARWLLWYAFALPMLAAAGLDRLGGWLRARLTPPSPARRGAVRALQALLVGIAFLELLAAARALPLSHPTAPQAYTSLRTAPAHVMAAQGQETAPRRFLSMSDIMFDPGDLADIQRLFQGQLDAQALYDYIVSVKRQEIIAPNLPLAWRLYAVDGYDGGLLPLARYIDLQRLFLPPSEILTDGRLRERLARVPPSRLLSLLGAGYVITDKVNDVWIDDVFYDLAFEAVLGAGGVPSISTADLPDFAATGLGLVSFLEGAQGLADGTPVARIELESAMGQVLSFTLRAGQDTAEGVYGPGVAHTQAQVGHPRDDGSDYVTRLEWGEPQQIVRLTATALLTEGRIHIRGLSLIDSRDGSNVPLILSTDGRFAQVHSGDVKIYRVLDALPRAYVVHQARVLADDEGTLAALADPTFDPGQAVVLAAGRTLAGTAPMSPAQVTTYAAERVVIEARAAEPGYLVLSDAWYPGWQALVDGEPAAIERANLHFRAVYLDPGAHTVKLVYRPASWRIGMAISLLALLGLSAAGVHMWRRRRA